jgi:hypothetical protein
MTYNPNHDRADWRTMSTRTLIEAARESGHELAIALGERLEELEHADTMLADVQAEAAELAQRVDFLRDELEATQAAWDAEAGA